MPENKEPDKRISFRDVPRLLQELACDDPAKQNSALRAACPCRNRRYDKELWLAIFQTRAETTTPTVRDAAEHAIGTLRERARNDPRSQELLLWLAEQGVTDLPLQEDVPTWIPNLRGNGLYIPRFEPSPRSRRNRRKR